MGTHCPCCLRGMGWRWKPAFSQYWRCKCGSDVMHTAFSFYEEWFRALVFLSVMLGIATSLVLHVSKILAWPPHVHLAVFALGAALTIAVCLVPVFVSCALMVGYRVGISFSKRAKVMAVVGTVLMAAVCPLVVWFMVAVVRGEIEAVWHPEATGLRSNRLPRLIGGR
jgi:hypothetical protein